MRTACWAAIAYLSGMRDAEVREESDERKQTVATYANHIQVLTLRNAELENEAVILRGQIAQATRGMVRPIRPHRGP